MRSDDEADRPLHYGADLARIHHEHFGMVARAAARVLIGRLSARGIASGRILDLAAGTGILSRLLSDRGFEVWGVDISDDMLRIARREAPGATFIRGSLWRIDPPPSQPPAVAVAAVGEAFSYAADAQAEAGLSVFEDRLRVIHGALAPGGVLLFDVATPGRSGPTGWRRVFWSAGDSYLGMVEHEDPAAGSLTRDITVFTREGELYRRAEEAHKLHLFHPQDVEAVLTAAGFAWERLRRYDDFDLMPGWDAYLATKRTS